VTFSTGDVVTVDFPGVTGIKRRPAVRMSTDWCNSWTDHNSVKSARNHWLCASGLGLGRVTGRCDISLFYRNFATICKFSCDWTL